MDFDTLERLWRSEANDRTSVAEVYLLEKTMETLTRRRKAFTFGMALIGAALLIWTGAIAYAVVVGKIADMTKEWGALVLLTVSWLAYLASQAQQRRHLNAHPKIPPAMPDVLRALIDENRTAQSRVQMMAIALVFFIVVLAICLWQLYAVGKMELRHIVQASIMAGSALGVSTIIQAVRYRVILRPEGERLRRLLDQYEEDQ
ncbi:hypothetical protein AEAC466_14730 [Asticcacaulis sp. AC466]|uniref:hypothetical protein n=1 Tax=Asticcacaulis sp. AC466 TaxID=1282362 RepID=UPI0003C405AB|nr:hypothetical protein [Asticcacaulis sp. AC466]ESQ83115.1 hypothetical protein AEAC466_14730 [Asticcacaulis sp. AC466]